MYQETEKTKGEVEVARLKVCFHIFIKLQYFLLHPGQKVKYRLKKQHTQMEQTVQKLEEARKRFYEERMILANERRKAMVDGVLEAGLVREDTIDTVVS